ncbi:MAG TPA: glycosyltransferase family 1 protein [Rhodospirillales bacterium]|nr:glycosyltransferase family 1 protein [Rhodospirillales bacterium]
MRILFCNYEYPPLGGGGGVINALLAEELARRHEVAVLTSQGLDLPRREEVRGVTVFRVPVLFRNDRSTANFPSMFAFMVQGTRFGRRLLRERRFDLVNTHFALPSGPVGAALARHADIPNVLSLHGGDLYDPSKWTSPHRHAPLRSWVRRLLRGADHLIGQSANTIANARRFYDPDLEISCIPLGIRRPSGEAADRRAHGFSDREVLLVTVGRLIARKAVDQLVALMPHLPPDSRLLIIGSGPKEEELRRQAAALGVVERVRFLGYVAEEEKYALLRMADLYVSTSQHEGFGLVFLEAMACGLPVICYDHGGQTDFLEDGVTGLLLPLNAREDFRRAVVSLIADPGRRRRMGEAARRRVEDYYIDNCARRYEEVFERVCAAHRNRSCRPMAAPLDGRHSSC